METICFEMATYVSRTATTPILNQSNERNATILDAQGRLAALSVGIPQFMLSIDAAGAVRARVPRGRAVPRRRARRERPLPRRRPPPRLQRVRARVLEPTRASCCSSRRSSATTATRAARSRAATTRSRKDIWSEGTRYPLLKIVEAGKRAARRRAHDARQQPARRLHRRPAVAGRRRAARRRPARRDHRDVRRRRRCAPRSTGPSTTRTGGSRDEIARWPDGTYEADVYVDTDPAGNRDIHVHVAVTVDGDRLIVDFDGSDDRPEHPGVVDVRQHARLHDRPAREPRRPDASRRTRASSTASTCASPRARA